MRPFRRNSLRALAALALLMAQGVNASADAPRENGTAEPAAGTALRIEIRGAIGPATRDYVVRGLERAVGIGARVVIIEMDTPGGLDVAMRDINKAILDSPVPVVTFVAPKGARAASAGTYILYASHVAAMAPATSLGAATPVQIGGGGEPEKAPPAARDERPGNPDGQGGAEPSSPAMERKAVNDAVAYIRSLAALRGRNAEWAEAAVREAATLTAEEAVAAGVVDFLAEDIAAVLVATDGRRARVRDADVVLDTDALVLERYEPDWRTRLLAVITDPGVAYFLLLIGIYGLVFEGYNPGAILPGVVGAICLLLALFAFQLLPVNYAGLGLIVLGVLLLIAEVFVPSFGALGLGGIVAFVFGSIMLLDSDIPGLSVSRGLIAGAALAASLTILATLTLVVKSRRRPVVSGREGLLGEVAEALADFEHEGAVFVHGERWQAHCPVAVRRGDPLRIKAVRGLVLEVEPLAARERSAG